MKEYILKLDEAKINQILTVLAKQPYHEVVELIQDIHLQANEQIKSLPLHPVK